jgi:ATP-dependent DNA helicase RecQ
MPRLILLRNRILNSPKRPPATRPSGAGASAASVASRAAVGSLHKALPLAEIASPDPLRLALKQYWGYEEFRPKQEEVVRGLFSGRDVCVVMPTGGGKSLCYQLPAVMRKRGTAVVISPLIALMQDQVAQLRQMGIPAAFLNSSVSESERSEVKRMASSGELRLLYLSPERAVMEGTASWLKRIAISFFAIDEAHCISEWGHDFRPEYRQLGKLRESFPEQPIAAFTASATQRVRHDIVQQLKLRDPLKCVSSFRRDNLRYVVKECKGGEQEEYLLRAVKQVKDGNVIVYSPTVARVGELVDLLEENGIAAVGYHGQMSSGERRANQEKWMTEEVRVLVGTIAFGLGINKPNVRAVVRLALPDGLEQLYQETGRAGRDGLPADCYLLWEKRDSGLRAYFIEQISSAKEKEQAWQRYHAMKNFVAGKNCRPKAICEYFGENAKWAGCGICDGCAGMPEWMIAGRAAAKKAAPLRVRRVHAIEAQKYEVAPAVRVDEELRDYLREWRRNTARDKMIAAFIVMHDTTLEQLCVLRPSSLAQLRQISGMGEKKCELYGREILDALRQFADGARASKEWHARPSSPTEETLSLLKLGHSFAEIASIRGRKVSSVMDLVASLVEAGETEFQQEWVAAGVYERVAEACGRLGMDLIRPIKQALLDEVGVEQIKLCVAHLRRAARTLEQKKEIRSGENGAAGETGGGA